VELSIQQVASASGISSRTLRHYDQIGLLPAGRGRNGYRTYGREDLVRLQRILLLRQTGMGLPQIAGVLAGQTDDVVALREHLESLRAQKVQLDRQMASVVRTISALEKTEKIMADEMFDGFDHTQYREEVEQRWGQQAYADSDSWWRGLGESGQQEFLAESEAIAAAWAQARAAGLAADSQEVAVIAARHARWIEQGWGGTAPSPEALKGLAEMYVADERFAAAYGGVEAASYVRDGLVAYAATQ
jgi:DNA-binding transcriptional MerR regulator